MGELKDFALTQYLLWSLFPALPVVPVVNSLAGDEALVIHKRRMTDETQ